MDTSCKLYFPNDAADDLHADTAQIPDTEPAVTTAYAQAIAEQLIAHDALPKGSQVLAISKDGDALSLDMNEAFLAGLRESGSTGELMYMGSLVNTFLDNFNCTTVRVTVNGQSFSGTMPAGFLLCFRRLFGTRRGSSRSTPRRSTPSSRR